MQSTPSRIRIGARPWWLFADGTVLPVISGGGTDDDPDDDEDLLDDPEDDNPKITDALRKKNSENRNLRRRLREAEAAKEELAELKKKDQSDSERLADELASEKSRADKAEAKASRYEVALNKGLTLRQANRLVGDSPEELEEDADDLLADLKGSAGDDTDDTSSTDDGPGTGRPAGRPTETLRGGGKPDDAPAPDIRSIVEGIKPVI